MIGFLVVGTIVVSITHKQDVQITQGSFDSTAIHVGDYQGYVEHIRPWLQTAFRDQSLDTIAQVKTNLLSVNSSDKDLGAAHVNLFLAFESWEKFLQTQHDDYRQQTAERLQTVAELVPELALDIQQLSESLN